MCLFEYLVVCGVVVVELVGYCDYYYEGWCE